MKIDKTKIFTFAGIVIATVASTLFSTIMQDREIEKNVQKHFDTMDSNKEEA